jgi:hypothetical protein
MEEDYFNKQLLNMLIGIFKGHKYQRPVSTGAVLLKYSVFGIERHFLSGKNEVNPDFIACSAKQGHTIIVEATYTDGLNTKKSNQITKYLAIDTNTLRNNAIVPGNAAKASTCWIIVREQALSSYRPVLNWKRNGNCVISSFSISPQGFKLTVDAGDFADKALTAVVGKEIFSTRIYPYIKINLSNLSDKSIFLAVAQCMMSFLIKKTFQFRYENIAQSLIKVWGTFDRPQQYTIVKAIRCSIKQLAQKKYASGLLTVADDTCVFNISNTDHLIFRLRLQKSINRYYTEISTPAQYAFDFE